MKKFLTRLLCVAALAAVPGLAVAADAYPSKLIKLIVPFPAGGPNDFFGRTLANQLDKITGQTVIVENKAGQAGTIGTDFVARSAPDGYTLVLTSSGSITINPVISEKPLYDPFKDLAPITVVAKVPEVLVSTPKLGFHSLADLINYAKANPGKINFGSAGSGGLPHLAGELLKREAKIDIVHIPYRGAAPALADLLGGQIDIIFLDIPVLLPHIQSGAVTPLALGSAQRAPTLPNVPTTAEAGLPNVLADNWYGLLAPGATPKPLAQQINALVVEALKKPELQQAFAKQGAIAVGDSPEDFAKFMRSETDKWGSLAKAVGVKID